MKRSGWILVPAAFFFILNFSIGSFKILFGLRLVFFLFFISLFLFLRRFNLDKILQLSTAGISVILFTYGIIQKFVLFPHYLKTLSPEQNFYSQAVLARIQSGRIFSLFTLPTLYAIVCSVLVLFIFHYFLKSSHKIPWAVLLLLGLVNLALTQSFGGIVYLTLGVLTYLFLSRVLNFKYLAPVLMVLALFFFVITGLRFSEAKKLQPVKLRLSNWNQALRMVQDSPFLGQGLGNYEARISYFTFPGEARSIYAHNFFLQFCAESGIFLPLCALIWLLVNRKKLKIPDPGDRPAVLYLSAFVILLVYNLIDIGFYFFSAGLAGSICLSQLYPARKKNNPKTNMIALLILGSILLIETLSVNYQASGDFNLNQGDAREAALDYRRSLLFFPFNIRSLLGYAHLKMSEGDTAAARRLAERALHIFPDSAAANFLESRLEFKANHYYGALYYARKAWQKNPLNRQYKRWYESLENRLQVKRTKPQD